MDVTPAAALEFYVHVGDVGIGHQTSSHGIADSYEDGYSLDLRLKLAHYVGSLNCLFLGHIQIIAAREREVDVVFSGINGRDEAIAQVHYQYERKHEKRNGQEHHILAVDQAPL